MLQLNDIYKLIHFITIPKKMLQDYEISRSNSSKSKRAKSMKRTPSALSINSRISGITSNASIVRQMSFKKRKTAAETAGSMPLDKNMNDLQSGYLTCLDVHDSNGDVVEGEAAQSDESEESQIHPGDVICISASSGFTIDLTRKNFTPTSKAPEAPQNVSPVVNNWGSYTSLASLVPSEKGSNVTINSTPHSISSFVKGIPKAFLSELSLRSGGSFSTSANASPNASPISEIFTIHDAEHAYLNKEKVKLSEIKHSTKRWLKIFKAKTAHIENSNTTIPSENSLSSFPNQLLFKKPAKATRNMNRLSWKSLVKSDPNIIPQKINFPVSPEDFKTNIKASRSINIKKHLFGDSSAPPINQSQDRPLENKIFSPNPDLKNSCNSPNYPEYLSGFSSLCIDVPVHHPG